MPTQTPTIVYLRRDDIYPDPDQPRERFDETELENLRNSLSEHGMNSPIAVRPLPNNYNGARHRIIFGERRWRASDGVLDQLPCIVRDVDDATAREMALDENFQRADLTAEEEANVVRGYLDEGLSISQIARKRNKSEGWVNNRIAYLKVGADVREVGGRVRKALSSLVLTDRVKDRDLRKSLLHRIETEELPFKKVEVEVKGYLEKRETQERAAENARQQQQAPDAHTQERQNAHDRGETSSMSRGQRVTGGVAAPASETRSQKRAATQEANTEVRRAASNLNVWLPLCDDEAHEAAVELARRILRGDLARR